MKDTYYILLVYFQSLLNLLILVLKIILLCFLHYVGGSFIVEFLYLFA